MKKILSIILAMVLSLGILAGCGTKTEDQNKEQNANIISPLPETLDINALDNCTVAISLENGGAYVNDGGKMVMDVTVYSYELYDMVDIAALKESKTERKILINFVFFIMRSSIIFLLLCVFL